MREEEFREVLRAVQRELEGVGLPEIADIENYRTESGAPIDARNAAVAMLKAFELHLATLDRTTYDKSMRKLRRSLRRKSRPTEAVIEIDNQTREVLALPSTIRLAEMPNLSRLRRSLRKLAVQLREARYDEPPSPARQ